MIPLNDPHTWATLARATGGAGLASMVLIFAPVIAMSSLGEPDADATREEAAAFFTTQRSPPGPMRQGPWPCWDSLR
jgi:hypothetical protein